MNSMNNRIKIGESLVENNLISREQLQDALTKQKETGKKLGKVLVESGIIDEHIFLEFFAKLLDVPIIMLADYKFNLEFAQILPEAQARLFHAILLAEGDNGEYLIGMADPQDIFSIDELNRILKHPLKIALVSERVLDHSLDLIYRRTGEISGFAEKLSSELKSIGAHEDEISAETDSAVLQLINSLFEDAVQVNASDIHIEPDKDVLRIRMRVDGILQEQLIRGKNINAAIAQRLKLMGGLNITETRLPQDGRFNIIVRNVPIDIRLSTMPIQYGESVVMRILNQASGVLDLDVIGMPVDVLQKFRKLIKKAKGIILVTGPTGSGKTTTLYAALNEMNEVSKKFITIEDPVEYRLPRINQVQVNTKLDLTFARVLRTALRQDPDIILVGEIRDQETAEIAMRAALTGHLVLATLHTNDAAGTAIRLVDMGVKGYLVAATVNAALAQRLVRRICENCKAEHKPTTEELNFFKAKFGDSFDSEKFFAGIGCDHCNNTGYHGRIGVYELLEYTAQMRDALSNSDNNKFLHLVEDDKDRKSLLSSSYDTAKEGTTTLAEVLRVAGEQD